MPSGTTISGLWPELLLLLLFYQRHYYRNYLVKGQGSGFLHDGGSYVTLTNGSDFSIVIEKMSWAHSQWFE
jgi:hypothetical protein